MGILQRCDGEMFGRDVKTIGSTTTSSGVETSVTRHPVHGRERGA
jgi:hypothetical protein